MFSLAPNWFDVIKTALDHIDHITLFGWLKN